MKPSALALVTLALSLYHCVPARGSTPSPAAAGSTTIVLVVVSQLDSTVANQVSAHLRSTFQSEVRVVTSVAVAPTLSIETASAIVASAMVKSDAIAIGLVSLAGSNALDIVAAATGRVAVLNVAQLMSVKATADLYMKRVKRETASAVARLLGLRACPNPTCCLFPHRDERELDLKGMNMCPPCFAKAESALRALGVDRKQPQAVRTRPPRVVSGM